MYNTAKKHGLGNSLNPIFNIKDVQHQILVSGKIGDGNFKKNGINYYYRETHSIKEKEYLLWKYNQMKNITTKKTYHHPKRNENQNDQISFQTRNSPTFEKYAKMSNKEAIDEMDELGFILLVLDDGWCRRYTNSFGYAISVAGITHKEQMQLLDKIQNVFKINCKMLGLEKENNGYIAINSKEAPKILHMILKYFPKDMDIIKNKFQHFII